MKARTAIVNMLKKEGVEFRSACDRRIRLYNWG